MKSPLSWMAFMETVCATGFDHFFAGETMTLALKFSDPFYVETVVLLCC